MLKGAVCLLSTTRGDIYFANIFAWQWRLSWLTSLLLNRVPLFLEKRLFAIFKPRFCHFGKFGVSVTRLFIVIFAILKSFFSPLYCLKWFLWAWSLQRRAHGLRTERPRRLPEWHTRCAHTCHTLCDEDTLRWHQHGLGVVLNSAACRVMGKAQWHHWALGYNQLLLNGSGGGGGSFVISVTRRIWMETTDSKDLAIHC